MKNITSKDPRKKEAWKHIEGYPDYMVSNMGRVKSLPRKIDTTNGRSWLDKGRVMQLGERKDGYLNVTLYLDKKPKTFSVHRLVAKAFITNPENKSEVHHINSNKKDNRTSNLAWATGEENDFFACKDGLKRKGQDHGMAKLTEASVLKIKELLKLGKTHRYIADLFGVSRSNISLISSGSRWGHINEK